LSFDYTFLQFLPDYYFSGSGFTVFGELIVFNYVSFMEDAINDDYQHERKAAA